MPAVRAMAGGGGVTLVMKWSHAMRMGMTDKPQCRALSPVIPRARQKAVVPMTANMAPVTEVIIRSGLFFFASSAPKESVEGMSGANVKSAE